MRRILLHGVCWLVIVFSLRGTAITVDTRQASLSSSSAECSSALKLDLRNFGPWQRHVAAASETLAYSVSWTTNAATNATAVVKAMPALKTRPKYIVIDLNGGTNVTSYGVSCLEDVPDGGWSDEYKTSKIVLRRIPAGTFVMGGRVTDFPSAVNTNLHVVTITKDFYMGVFEITQRQWELVMGTRPSVFSNETCYATRPVERVSYQDIRGSGVGLSWPMSKDIDDESFMSVLRRRTGMGGFDLPTEAQWEYACRAGTTTALNSGKDISTLDGLCSNISQVARCGQNSKRAEFTNLSDAIQALSDDDDAVGTAKVGSYLPNQWELFDMHGNVYELCLDLWSAVSSGSIDPVGPTATASNTVELRGGAWHTVMNRELSCGYKYTYLGKGYSKTGRMGTVGFRICLQGGDVPDFAAAVIVVEEGNGGTVNWSPSRAGSYYLTHSTMNGATNVQMLSAQFEVPGCKLALSPLGEQTNGVSIAISGAGEGWTTYYTVDGSTPSVASTVYNGPFALPESGTVRAIAYNEHGMASEEVSSEFVLHDALDVKSVVARQRYPWNGKVDVDCEFVGDTDVQYGVSLSAVDTVGNTNLPTRTAWVDGTAITNTTFNLKPGKHRLVWDADADLASDIELSNVALKVTATAPAHKALLTVNGYAGTKTLNDVPVLVRLSAQTEGFSYEAMTFPETGADICFTDEAGTTVYPYEIDEWHSDGESLVWVKLPELKAGTKFVLHYGGAALATANERSGKLGYQAEKVWEKYSGVWHMGEDDGAAFDSTANALDAWPMCGTNKLADTSQMVAFEDGACGRARVNGLINGYGGNFLSTKSGVNLGFGGEFVAGGWVYINKYVQDVNLPVYADGTVNYDDPRLISTKVTHYNQKEGFEIQVENKQFCAKAQTNSYIVGGSEIAVLNWVYLVANYAGTNVNLYVNGALVKSGVIKQVIDLNSCVAIGNNSKGIHWSLNGQYDEVRLSKGSLPADRIKADYDMVVNKDFIGFAEVEDDTAEKATIAQSPDFWLSVKHDGIRTSEGSETLRYSNLWNGDADSTVTIRSGESVVAEGLQGEGGQAWSVTKGGEYTLTHTTMKDGAKVGETLTATFIVPSHELEIDDGTDGEGGEGSRFSYSGMYDGQGHGINVALGEEIENPVIAYALNKDGPYIESLLMTNACAATPVWYTIDVAGYNTYTNWATVTITPRAVVLTSGDASGVYTGIAVTNHTVTVSGDGFVAGEGASFNVTGKQLDVGSSANTFIYTLNANTLEQNYTITSVEGTLTVTKAKVGPTGGEEPGDGEVPEDGLSKFDTTSVYDGVGHTIDTNALVTAFDSVMGSAAKDTKIYYEASDDEKTEPKDGWKLETPLYTNVCEAIVWYKVTNPNYEDYVYAAKVTITNRAVVVDVVGQTASYVYDGSAKSVEGYDATTGDALYDIGKDTTFSGVAKVSRTDVGTSAMGLSAADFVNQNANFAVTYKVTDGSLTVTKAKVGPTGGDEPGDGEVPDDGLSKFDTTSVYDGGGHTVDTNALVAAFDSVMGTAAKETEIWYAASDDATSEPKDGWKQDAPLYTNVCEAIVWYKVTNPNYEDYVHAAKVTITNRAVVVDVVGRTASYVYDGSAKSIEGYDATTGDVLYDIGKDTTFSGVAKVSRTEVGTSAMELNAADFENQNANFAVTYKVTDGSLTVTKAKVDPMGGDEPGDGEVPEDGLSKFDMTSVYDGVGHTIDTNALVTAFDSVMGSAAKDTKIYYTASDDATSEPKDGWKREAPLYTNVCEGIVWYKAVNPNYEDYVHAAKVTITNRTVEVDVVGQTASYVYDGSVKSVEGYEATTSDALYDIGKDTTFSGVAKVSRIEVGTSGMGLSAADFVNQNANFAVTYKVTDGGLTVTKAKVGPTGGEEPGDGEVPEDGLSKFDTTSVYDGVGHTIDTNALVTAFDSVMGSAAKETKIYYTALDDEKTEPKDGWKLEAPLYTNVCEAIVWYKVVNPNYEDYVHAAKVTITNRAVVVNVVGQTASYVYDGSAKSVEGYEATTGDALYDIGKDTTFSGAAKVSRTEVGTSAMGLSAADFENQNANFAVTYKVTDGSLTVTKAKVGPTGGDEPGDGDVPDGGLSKFDTMSLYDGVGHTIDTNALVTAFDSVMGSVAKDTEVWYAASDDATSEPKDGWKMDVPLYTNVCEAIVWYKVTNPNYEDYVHAAKVTITNRAVVVDVVGQTASYVYDGSVKSVEGYDATTGDVLYDIGKDTTFSGVAKVSRMEVGTSAMGLSAADFVNQNTNFAVTYNVTDGSLTITKAKVVPTGGEEPGDGDVPEDGLSKFDMTSVYDGTGHTIDTNSLVTAFDAVMGAAAKDTEVWYAASDDEKTGPKDGWQLDAPLYTNVCEAIVWYKVVNPNYEDYVHAAKVRVLPREVTLTSGSAARAYTGQPLTNAEVKVSGDGFVEGEGVVYSVTGAQTTVGTSKNKFTYVFKENTKAGNYTITTKEGELVVTKAKYPGQGPDGVGITWNVDSEAATWMYDGLEHGVEVTGLPEGVTPVYTGNKATDVGNYTATVSFEFDDVNYEAPRVPEAIQWSITARPITLMTASKEKPYDGFPLEVSPSDITASGSGYAEGECFTYYDYASITDVGEAAATFKYRDSATAKVSNYRVTVKSGQTLKVTVGSDQISVTADSGVWAYDGEAHTMPSWTFLNEDKLLDGHEFQIKISDGSTVTTPKDGLLQDGVVSNTFEYVRIVDTESGADRTRNYNLFLYEGVLKVTNACIRAEQVFGTEKIEKVYDGIATQVNIKAELLQRETVHYGYTADDISLADTPSFVNATNTIVWFTVAADYYNTYTGHVDVVINPRQITFTSPTKKKTYDGTPLTFTAADIVVSGDGLIGDDSFSFTNFSEITDADKVNATFEYVADEGTLASNYAVTTNWGTLTILASADQITITAKDGEWTYSGVTQTLQEYVAENADKLQAGDELVVDFSEASCITTPEDGPNQDGVVSNVITSVRVMRKGATDVTRNYSLVAYPGVLRMKNADITVDAAAFATTATYDGEGHTANVVAPALLSTPVTVCYGLTADAITLTEAPEFVDALTHTVFYSISAKYYNTYYGSTTVTILPREVTLVSSGATRVYDGTALQKGEVCVKESSLGFVKEDGFAATCSGAITSVGAMENLFDYELTGETKAGNYTITKEYGWLRVTPATLDPSTVFGGDGDAEFLVERTYNGAAQPFALEPNFDEPYKMYYAYVENNESAYTERAPTLKNVADGTLTVYFKFTSANYLPYYGKVLYRITPKTLTDEMVVADEDVAWFYDGTEKKPAIIVVDGTPNIATTNDYHITYQERTSAGLFPVTVTATNNYTGTIEKTFEIMKRPVATPVIGTEAYTGKKQTATIPADERWEVILNEGGIDVGEYPVTLRLTNSNDYRWKSLDDPDETDLHLIFTITKQGNRIKVKPSLASWTNGVEEASTPAMGRDRFGNRADYVEYRVRGADVATGAREQPTTPGKYTARFVWEETVNYTAFSYEVDFEIYSLSLLTETQTTPEPVPYTWLDPYLAKYGKGDYERAGYATGQNGRPLWESYVAGLDPEDPQSDFVINIQLDAKGDVSLTWTPDLRENILPRKYTEYGKVNLTDSTWTPLTEENRGKMRFFQVTVEINK